MNAVTNIWRQLVRSRLWPLALLLVAALAAVPFVLAKEPEPVIPTTPESTAAPAEVADADDPMAEPVIAKASTKDRSRRRRVLGSRKDPFEPAPVKKSKKTEQTDTSKDETKTVEEPAKSGGSDPGPTAPVDVTPKPKPKVYEKDSLIVRFGDATGALKRMNLKKLGGLPQSSDSEDLDTLLIYTGLTRNGTKAVFLVDASLDATGDGTCQPHPSNCETVELGKGETEFFDLIDPETGETIAQYELDVLDIK